MDHRKNRSRVHAFVGQLGNWIPVLSLLGGAAVIAAVSAVLAAFTRALRAFAPLSYLLAALVGLTLVGCLLLVVRSLFGWPRRPQPNQLENGLSKSHAASADLGPDKFGPVAELIQSQNKTIRLIDGQLDQLSENQSEFSSRLDVLSESLADSRMTASAAKVGLEDLARKVADTAQDDKATTAEILKMMKACQDRLADNDRAIDSLDGKADAAAQFIAEHKTELQKINGRVDNLLMRIVTIGHREALEAYADRIVKEGDELPCTRRKARRDLYEKMAFGPPWLAIPN